MSDAHKNLEKTFHKLDNIITLLSTINECNQINIYLEEVIADLDVAISVIRER